MKLEKDNSIKMHTKNCDKLEKESQKHALSTPQHYYLSKYFNGSKESCKCWCH